MALVNDYRLYVRWEMPPTPSHTAPSYVMMQSRLEHLRDTNISLRPHHKSWDATGVVNNSGDSITPTLDPSIQVFHRVGLHTV